MLHTSCIAHSTSQCEGGYELINVETAWNMRSKLACPEQREDRSSWSVLHFQLEQWSGQEQILGLVRHDQS